MTREAIPRSGSDVATNPPRQIACLVGVAVWLVYITTAGGSLGTGDAVAMYEEAKAIAFRGAMDVPLEQSIEAWRGASDRGLFLRLPGMVWVPGQGAVATEESGPLPVGISGAGPGGRHQN